MTEIIFAVANQSRPLARPLCKVEECCARAITRGMCSKHYKRVLKHGDPHTVLFGARRVVPPRTVAILRICGEYNASAPEAAWILGVERQTVRRLANAFGIALRRDPPGQERFFSESRTHRQFVMRKFMG